MSRPGGPGSSSLGGGSGKGGSGVSGDASTASPFMTPAHGNPAFAPQKMGVASTPGGKNSSVSIDKGVSMKNWLKA